MDFYQHQDQARRNTALLVILLLAAVAALILVTALFTTLFIHYFQLGTGIHLQAAENNQNLWQLWLSRLNLELFVTVGLVVLVTVILAGQLKILQLRRGGEAVAAALNGRLLQRDLASGQDRQLLNVVEEMAIASGSPVPPTYVFDEPGINAFAAGYGPSDAVIGITRGALDTLNREQLQGVIAHEFSHILNGDMRLNMRLISLISGITVVGSVGQLLLRGSGGGLHHRRDSKRGGAMVFGLGLVVIGFAGTLFGKIISSATSRQREFLADASAVQYTRNPNGIAGALQAIKNSQYGSQWRHANAAEFNHLYFGRGDNGFLSRLFATHPPLDERIARIKPGISISQDGTSQESTSQDGDAAPYTPANQAAANGNTAAQGHALPLVANAQSHSSAEQTDAATGSSNHRGGHPVLPAQAAIVPAGISSAAQQLQRLPINVASQTGNIFAARALVYGVLMGPMTNHERATAIAHLGEKSHPRVFAHLRQLLTATMALPRKQQWLVLLESLPTLKQLSATQKTIFIRNSKYLIEHDSKITLFEWCVFELCTQACKPSHASLIRELSEPKLPREVAYLLSFIGHSNGTATAVENQLQQLGKNYRALKPIEKQAISLSQLTHSVRQLRHLPPLQKPSILKAANALMSSTKGSKHSDQQAILLQTLALCLDCPMPDQSHA